MSELTFGKRVGAIKRSFLNHGIPVSLRTVWIPRIEINSKFIAIGDNSTQSKFAEFPTRNDALKYARALLKRKRGEFHEPQRKR